MQLLTIRAAGFTATVDACAQDEGQLWLISMLGSQQAVRAIWARLLKGETAYLAEDELAGGTPCWLAREAWGTWRFFRGRLPSGFAYQGMLVPDLAAYAIDRQEFLLLARHEEEAPLLHYRFLNRRVDIPLHQSWSGWLWERGLNTEEIQALESVGVQAFHCRPIADALQADLAQAIRQRVLSVPGEELMAMTEAEKI
ncbi:MAG: hypothetical protein GEU75_17250 [Dehalococcoidia bacterium]|nr:hypothetical protein [Dehalococcoidia bacterium]